MTTESRTFRGSAWNSGSGNLASTLRNSAGPGAATGNLGFRVAAAAAVPEPLETSVVVGLGAVSYMLVRMRNASRQAPALGVTQQPPGS